MYMNNVGHYFLQGGGEMGKMIRDKDWNKTALGNPDTWPQSLRTMVAVMLDNPFAMYIAWGKDYIQLYNDGYRPILGATKHPHALGASTRETFSEIWHIIGSMFEGVMQGKGVGFPDFMLPLNRNGYEEECYFDFSYSPIRLDTGEVGGVLVTVIETTQKKRATDALKESNSRFINNIMQAPVAMCIFRGNNHVVEIANQQMLELWGKQAEEIIGKPIFEGLPEAKDQGLEVLLDNVFQTGEKFIANERPVKLPRNGRMETTYINFVYEALKDPDTKVTGIVAIAIEVTAQVISRVRVEESEEKVRAVVENSPFPIAVYVGKEMRIDLANQTIIDLWGKGNDVIGKSFRELMPELESQGVFEQIERVMLTGEPFYTKNTPIDLYIDGDFRTYYFNYNFTPIYDLNENIYGVINTAVDLTEQNASKIKIEESEENIRSMVLQSPIGICVIDAETLIAEIVNDSFVEIAGKPYDTIAGNHYWDTFAEVKHIYEPALNKVIAEGESYYANEVSMPLIRHGREEIIYVTFVYAPIKNREGKVKKVTVWVLDNTPQVKARIKIEEADKKFRNTVQQAPVGITILRGPDYIVEMANDAYLYLVDRKEESFIGKPLFDVLPEIKETVHGLLDGVLCTGIPYHSNEAAIPVNRYGKQDVIYFDILYYPLREEDGNISGVIVTITEVTEKVESRKRTEQNEERLNIVVEASELGTWELNLETMEPHYSKRYLEIVGGYKDNITLTHEQLLKHLHPDDMPVRQKAFKEAMATGNLFYEARLIWLDQSIHWMEGKGKVFYNADGKPVKMIGTIRDITSEKHHQQVLEESELRFRNLIMQSPVAKAILKGKDHIIEIANNALLHEIWNKEEKDVIGISMLEVFPELKHQKFVVLLDEVFNTGIKHTEKEFLIVIGGRDEARLFYLDLELAPLIKANDNVSGIKITAIDVTEKVEARKKIEESEKRFRSLAESLPQLVWETDEKGNPLFASEKWKEYTGINPDGAEAWMAVIHPDDFEENSKSWMHSLKTGDLYRSNVRLKSKEGDYRWHRVIGEPVYGKDGLIVKWVGAFTDVHTEQAFTQELERKVAERTKELASSNVELAKMNKELQSFAYISSHDLQEPLRKIQTFSSQLMEREYVNLTENGRDKFLRIQNAANRMQTLIDDLLTYSRTNTQDRKFEETDLKKIVTEVKEDLKEELQHKQATIEVGDMCKATIIPFQFRQLLFNLINNSLKFSHPDRLPVIKIKSEIALGAVFNNTKLDNDTKYCHISIGDNGIGFEQQYSERIFELFQRLHGKNEYNGTGIGLSIVKRIVDNHNGIITATGQPDKGAAFDIYIPA